MADPTPKSIIEQDIAAKIVAKPELQKDTNAVIVLEITGAAGGKWTLDLTKPTDCIKEGADGVTPAMTVVCGDADFVAVCTRKLDANMAVMSGKMKLKPMNLNLARKLGKLLR